jgi:hypothetical protein
MIAEKRNLSVPFQLTEDLLTALRPWEMSNLPTYLVFH